MRGTGRKMRKKEQEAAGKSRKSSDRSTVQDDPPVTGAVEHRSARVRQAVQRANEHADGKEKGTQGS